MITKDQFIDAYLSRSKIEAARTPDGYIIEGYESVALPCNCGEEMCEGWQMVSKSEYVTKSTGGSVGPKGTFG